MQAEQVFDLALVRLSERPSEKVDDRGRGKSVIDWSDDADPFGKDDRFVAGKQYDFALSERLGQLLRRIQAVAGGAHDIDGGFHRRLSNRE